MPTQVGTSLKDTIYGTGGTIYLHRGAPRTYTGGHQSAWSDKLPHPRGAVNGAVVDEAGSVGAIE